MGKAQDYVISEHPLSLNSYLFSFEINFLVVRTLSNPTTAPKSTAIGVKLSMIKFSGLK
jgi:hypothetical protein